MKKLVFYLLVGFLMNSCVDLPNLLPNGEGENIDMFIYDLNINIAALSFDGTVVVDDDLTIKITRYPNEADECFYQKVGVNNGQVLVPKNFEISLEAFLTSNTYNGLSQGELVNGYSTSTKWANDFHTYLGYELVPQLCSYVSSLNPASDDVYVGFRFKINTKWHYGWMLFDPNFQFPNGAGGYILKQVAYNKNAGTNVRIGG